MVSPRDIAGKRVGLPSYRMTAAVWIRGLLSAEFGVAPDSVRYVTGGLDTPEPMNMPSVKLYRRVDISDAPAGESLAAMLVLGDLAALYTAKMPTAFSEGAGTIRRLFPDFGKIERAYYGRTRIFPIMHTIVIQLEIHERHPWLAGSLFRAFGDAKRLAEEALYDTDALRTMLPWMIESIEEAKRTMGPDWWPYGFRANRHVLDTFLGYHFEQGLSERRLAPEDLFPPEFLET